MSSCVLSYFSHVPLFVTSWTVACQVPLSMEILPGNAGVGWINMFLDQFVNNVIFPTYSLNKYLSKYFILLAI